jgi:hypothetical protein
MRIILLSLLLFIVFPIRSHAGGSPEHRIEPTGETIVSENIGNHKVIVRIRTHTIDIGKPSDETPKERESNCTYSRYPCVIVDSVKISVNGNPIPIPRSVFSDLADLNSGYIKPLRQGMALTLTAGDAAEAYVVEITFNAKQILQRRIFDAEFPDETLEKTIYLFKSGSE